MTTTGDGHGLPAPVACGGGRTRPPPLPALPPAPPFATPSFPTPFRQGWVRLDRTSRLLAGATSGLGAAVFLLAAWLCPYDSEGQPLSHGTHRQLGLPPCHFQSLLGLPCPSCGMTTSVSLCMHGDFRAACRVNWAGGVVTALGIATVAWLAAIAAAGRAPPCLRPDQAVQWLAIAGVGAAMVRYPIELVRHLVR